MKSAAFGSFVPDVVTHARKWPASTRCSATFAEVDTLQSAMLVRGPRLSWVSVLLCTCPSVPLFWEVFCSPSPHFAKEGQSIKVCSSKAQLKRSSLFEALSISVLYSQLNYCLHRKHFTLKKHFICSCNLRIGPNWLYPVSGSVTELFFKDSRTKQQVMQAKHMQRRTFCTQIIPGTKISILISQ